MNICYVDGQNLHLWVSSDGRAVDLKRLRIYLKDKFNIEEAYYYMWFLSEDQQELYNTLQKAWFIVVFREHSSTLKWKKKGNVDVDIVFEIMRRLHDDNDFEKLVLISWDGDYIKLVKYLIKKDKLLKIIFPNRKYSSLYKQITNKHYYCLSNAKTKIAYKKKGS